MAVVSTWDGANREIHLLSGVTEFHPIDDIYREYRTERASNEAFRVWEPFMTAEGNEPKGGGKFTSRYLLLLDGVKIIPFDEANEISVTGEVLTDDQTTPFDTSTITNPVIINYAPPDTELVEIGGSGLTPDEQQRIDDIWTRLFGGRLYVDPDTAKEVILTAAGAPFSEADVWSDDGVTGYDGTAGVARRDGHVKP